MDQEWTGLKLDDLKLPLDYYELKARIAPAIFLSVPVLLTLWSCYKEEFTGLSDILKGIISLAIIICFFDSREGIGKEDRAGVMAILGRSAVNPSSFLEKQNNWRRVEGALFKDRPRKAKVTDPDQGRGGNQPYQSR
jgi:hypothetical protein